MTSRHVAGDAVIEVQAAMTVAQPPGPNVGVGRAFSAHLASWSAGIELVIDMFDNYDLMRVIRCLKRRK